jgi:hypothetical protein
LEEVAIDIFSTNQLATNREKCSSDSVSEAVSWGDEITDICLYNTWS